MVTQRRGARGSAANAWLRPALRRKNLTLITNATATRVIFIDKQAVGVEFEKNGTRQFVRAERESAGSRQDRGWIKPVSQVRILPRALPRCVTLLEG